MIESFRPMTLINVRTDSLRTTKLCITHVGERGVFLGSMTPRQQGGGTQALPDFSGSLLFMDTPFDAQLPDLTWKHERIGMYHGVIHASHPKRAEF